MNPPETMSHDSPPVLPNSRVLSNSLVKKLISENVKLLAIFTHTLDHLHQKHGATVSVKRPGTSSTVANHLKKPTIQMGLIFLLAVQEKICHSRLPVNLKCIDFMEILGLNACKLLNSVRNIGFMVQNLLGQLNETERLEKTVIHKDYSTRLDSLNFNWVESVGKFVKVCEDIVVDDDIIYIDDEETEMFSADVHVPESFHKELLSKESLIDDIKLKAHDLVKNRDNVPGKEDLQATGKLTSLEEKHLAEMAADLRDFKESHHQLNTWLTEKDKMMAVLGPLATDQGMIETQLQQVQEESSSQELLYEQFLQSGNAILENCSPESSHALSISTKMDTVSKVWDRFQSRLKEREDSLHVMEGLSTVYTQLLEEISDWMSGVNHKLSDQSAATSSPDELQEQLADITNLERDAEEKRGIIAKAGDVCKALCDKTKDATTKNELCNKLSNIEKEYADVMKNIGERKSAIAKASQEGSHLRDRCQDILTWLSDAQKRLGDEGVSGQRDELTEQAHAHQLLQQEIISQEPEVMDVLQRSRHLLQDMPSSSPASYELAEQLEAIENEWDHLKSRAGQRQGEINESMSHATVFYHKLDQMLMWLEMSEEKLDGVSSGLTLERDDLQRHLTDIKALQNDTRRKITDHDALNHDGQLLMDRVHNGSDYVDKVLTNYNDRWNKLNQAVSGRVEEVEEASQRLGEYEDAYQDVDAQLTTCEGRFQTHCVLGHATRDPQHRDKIQSLQDDIQSLTPQVDYVEALVNGLRHGTTQLDNGQLVQQVDEVKTRHRKLQDDLAELASRMDARAQLLGQFETALVKAKDQLSELDRDFQSKACVPCGRDAVVSQLEDLGYFKSQLSDRKNALTDLQSQADDLITAGCITESQRLQEQVSDLNQLLADISLNAHDHESELLKQQRKLETFRDSINATIEVVDKAVAKEELQSPVGGDISSIKKQQEQLQAFVKSEVESLQKRIDSVNDLGQGLIQNAAPGTNTSNVESDLEILAGKFADLSEKVSDRERRLDTALLQSGKFNDALASLVNWLAETEEMVLGQKPPSPEFNVVKAQLQEQSFLLRMLEDRSPSVKSLADTGDQLVSALERPKQHAIQKQLGDFMHRWDALSNDATRRRETLEAVADVAKSFQDLQDLLLEWLDSTENKWRTVQSGSKSVSGTQALNKQADVLKALQNDTRRKITDHDTLNHEGQLLMDSVHNGRDYVDKVLTDYNDRWNKLNQAVSGRVEEVEEASQRLGEYEDAYQDVDAQLTTCEGQFQTHCVLGHAARDPQHRDKIQSQQDDIQSLTPQVDYVEALVDGLRHGATQLDNGHLVQQVDEVKTRHKKLQDDLAELASGMDVGAQLLGQFETALVKAKDQLSELDRDFQSKAWVPCDLDAVVSQLEDLGYFNSQLADRQDALTDLQGQADDLITAGCITESQRLQEQVSDLNQLLADISLNVHDHESDLLKQQQKLETFRDSINSTLKVVDKAVAKEELQSPVGGDINSIKKQQEQLKVFVKSEVESLQKCIDSVNDLGQGLIQNAGPGTNTSNVESDLEILAEKFADLSEKVSDRERRLDTALLQSGKFNDALAFLVSWLVETEEMVAGQKTPSPEFKVVKAQLQEQSMLEDHSPSVESLADTGDQLVSTLESPKQHAIQKKLGDFMHRWDALSNDATRRCETLEAVADIAKSFQDFQDPLLEWLDSTEIKLGTVQSGKSVSGTQALNKQADVLKNLDSDLERHQDTLTNLNERCQELLPHCSDDVEQIMRGRVELINDRFDKLQSQIQDNLCHTEAALPLAENFQDAQEKLFDWLAHVEPELRGRELTGNKGQLQKHRASKQRTPIQANTAREAIEQMLQKRRISSKTNCDMLHGLTAIPPAMSEAQTSVVGTPSSRGKWQAHDPLETEAEIIKEELQPLVKRLKMEAVEAAKAEEIIVEAGPVECIKQEIEVEQAEDEDEEDEDDEPVSAAQLMGQTESDDPTWKCANPDCLYINLERNSACRQCGLPRTSSSAMAAEICGQGVRVELSKGRSRRGGGGVWRGGGGYGVRGGRGGRPFDPNDRCYGCGVIGHYAYDCFRSAVSRRGGVGGGYGGGGGGHRGLYRSREARGMINGAITVSRPLHQLPRCHPPHHPLPWQHSSRLPRPSIAIPANINDEFERNFVRKGMREDMHPKDRQPFRDLVNLRKADERLVHRCIEEVVLQRLLEDEDELREDKEEIEDVKRILDVKQRRLEGKRFNNERRIEHESSSEATETEKDAEAQAVPSSMPVDATTAPSLGRKEVDQ